MGNGTDTFVTTEKDGRKDEIDNKGNMFSELSFNDFNVAQTSPIMSLSPSPMPSRRTRRSPSLPRSSLSHGYSLNEDDEISENNTASFQKLHFYEDDGDDDDNFQQPHHSNIHYQTQLQHYQGTQQQLMPIQLQQQAQPQLLQFPQQQSYQSVAQMQQILAEKIAKAQYWKVIYF